MRASIESFRIKEKQLSKKGEVSYNFDRTIQSTRGINLAQKSRFLPWSVHSTASHQCLPHIGG